MRGRLKENHLEQGTGVRFGASRADDCRRYAGAERHPRRRADARSSRGDHVSARNWVECPEQTEVTGRGVSPRPSFFFVVVVRGCSNGKETEKRRMSRDR